MRATLFGLSVVIVASLTAAAPANDAPGAPGEPAVYQPADKQGFGTAHGGAESPVWFTLGGGRMTEVFYPDLSTPGDPRVTTGGDRRPDVHRRPGRAGAHRAGRRPDVPPDRARHRLDRRDSPT